MKKGLLIAFEGPDGSGKSTQIELLKEYLRNRGFKVIFTREPGGTKISENIRDIILDTKNDEMSSMCEALLYAASRAQLVEEIISPALDRGEIVICDRFVQSSIVYQGIARGLGIERIKFINEAALGTVKADFIFMLNLSYKEGLKRKMLQQKLDRLESSGDEFHKRVFQGYEKINHMYDNIINIDADQEKEVIHEKIVKILEERLALLTNLK